MTGYIIGLILGIVIFILQNLKPTSVGFRIASLLTTILFLWGIYYAHAGFWNILIIPIGVSVLCFISALIFPYMETSAMDEYAMVNGRDYYSELKDEEKIGKLLVPGFKQTYDRILCGTITGIVSTNEEFRQFAKSLYATNFYPISSHTKREVLSHIQSVIEDVANSSIRGEYIRTKGLKEIKILFNAYLSVMYIHEEATNNIMK